MIAATDPFMTDVPTRRPGDFRRNSQGTPQVSDPTSATVKGGARKGEIKWQSYSRPSGFHKIIEDMYSIHKWDQRQNVYGFAIEPSLVERAQILVDIEDHDSKQWKDEADKIIKAAKLVAKASISADRGSHTHGLAEDDDEGRDILSRIADGEELGMPPYVQRSLVDAWRTMLARDGLEILAVEMPVVNDTYRAAGTLDRVARLTRPLRFRLVTGELIELPAGTIVILDIKTGKRRLNNNGTVMYWQGYAVQVFLYGPTSRPYDTETDTRGEWPWKVNEHWALIAHLDVLGALDGKPSCELILVDLDAGRRAADLCVAAKAWANDATVFSVAQIAAPCPRCGGAGMITVGDGDYEGASCHDEPCPDCGATDVGVDEASAGLPIPAVPESAKAIRLPAPDSGTPSQDVGDTAGMTPQEVTDAEAGDKFARAWWINADGTPSQGADLSSPEFELLWAKIRHEHDALPTGQREWVNRLSREAMQANVSFHTRTVQTERSYHLCKALVTLAAAGADDDILRELMTQVHPRSLNRKTIGACVGSLNHQQAERLATLADQWAAPPPDAA